MVKATLALLTTLWLIAAGANDNRHIAVGASLYWQLQGALKQHTVSHYGIDLEEHQTSGKIDELQAQGIAVICYISAGSFEDWRKDRQLFRPEEIGKPLGDWPGERWLDIRSKNVLAVMATRLDRAVRAGCDAVEPDNLDGYQHDTGFSFTADDQIAYLHELVQLAHQRDLSIGLKNAVGLIRPGNLASHFDWALNEECYTYNECDLLRPFIDNNKAVFIAQYADKPVAAQCRHAKYNRFNLSYYDPDYLLNGSQYLVCPE